MQDNRRVADARGYRAFISYSHADRGFVRRLHRWLEGYRLPRRLVGGASQVGPIPARLIPIFRDREDLAAAHDLSTEVRAALSRSASLIVVCSPAAAASPWVDREIALFRELHPDRPILAALIAGTPDTAFPPALRGSATRAVEPLAADFRSEADGPRAARLKLVAGMLGIEFDALAQRDAQRRLRAVTAVTLASLTAVLAMAVLTVMALAARADAERQRREADRQRGKSEELIEFMLTDLPTKLKGEGIGALDAVNAKASAYYQDQNLASLPPESLARHARLFHAMGKVDERRDRLDAAVAKFQQARKATAALLAREPKNAKIVEAHSLSEYWIGYAEFQRKRYAAARPAFENYRRLTYRLVELEPANANYRREAGFGEGNICSLELKSRPVNVPLALRTCRASLAHMLAAAPQMPLAARVEVDADIANRHGWLGEAFDRAGDIHRADVEFRRQRAIAARLMADDPQNLDHRDTWVTVLMTSATRDIRKGRLSRAIGELREAEAIVARTIPIDPIDDRWRRRQVQVERGLNDARVATLLNWAERDEREGDRRAAIGRLNAAHAVVAREIGADPDNDLWPQYRARITRNLNRLASTE